MIGKGQREALFGCGYVLDLVYYLMNFPICYGLLSTFKNRGFK